MKNILLFALILLCSFVQAQEAAVFNYQALIFNGTDKAESICNESVQVMVELLKGDELIGSEQHQTATDCYGIVQLPIGTEGLNFRGIDWANGPFSIQLKYDFGDGEQISGKQRLNYVPYALYAPRSGDGVEDIILDEEGQLVIQLHNGDEKTVALPIDGDACWDLNANGVADLPTEDLNGDGKVDRMDCRGESGAQGESGMEGPAGPQGEPGPQGAVGEIGPAGPQGEPGPQGAVGETGSAGPQGAVGAEGPAGPQGDTGEGGPAGPAGAQGQQGAVGAAGPAGPQGARGPAGETGPAGPAGQSNLVAYGMFDGNGRKSHGSSSITATENRSNYTISVRNKSLSASNCVVQITPISEAHTAVAATFNGGSLIVSFDASVSYFSVCIYQ